MKPFGICVGLEDFSTFVEVGIRVGLFVAPNGSVEEIEGIADNVEGALVGAIDGADGVGVGYMVGVGVGLSVRPSVGSSEGAVMGTGDGAHSS